MDRPRATSDRGFSLVEILVVMLIIAILAVIAVPVYLGQREKAQDGEAKANARSLSTLVEACATTTEDYRNCESGDADLGDARLAFGDGPGQVAMAAPAARRYEVTAVSQSGRSFVIERDGSGRVERRCAPAGRTCRDGAW